MKPTQQIVVENNVVKIKVATPQLDLVVGYTVPMLQEKIINETAARDRQIAIIAADQANLDTLMASPEYQATLTSPVPTPPVDQVTPQQ